MKEVKRYVLDYYIKGLDMFTQRTVWEYVADRITERECEMLIDGENGFKNVYRSGVYKNRQEIEPFLQLQQRRFEDANNLMKKNKRFPLFENTSDLIESAKRHNVLVSFLPESECNKIVGCKSFSDYEPKIYEPTEQEKQK